LEKTRHNIDLAEENLKKEGSDEEVKSKMEGLMKKEEAVVKADGIIAQEEEQLHAAEDNLKGKHPDLAKEKIDTMAALDSFYILLKNNDEGSQELALTVDMRDKYFPKKTGLYGVSLQNMITKGEDRLTQLWSYDSNNQALFSKYHPGSALFEGGNKLPSVYTFRNMKNQIFIFETSEHLWVNPETKNSLGIVSGYDFEPGALLANLKVGKDLTNLQWKIEPASTVVAAGQSKA
jgi:hypothetical protein